MEETHFYDFWHTTLRPETPAKVVAHWREYVFSGVSRGQAIVDIVRRHIDLDGAQVLDVGCGFGGASIAFSLAGSTVTGIDIDYQKLHGAQIWACLDYQVADVTFLQATLARQPFADLAFDVVLCADVLEHVESQKRAIAQIARILRQGGVAVVSFPNYCSLKNLYSDPHYRQFGISVLPRPIAAWYVVHIKHLSDTYRVGYLPIASVLQYRFRQHGMEVVWQNPILRRNLGPMTALARTIRMNTYPLVHWVVRKR